MQDDDWITERNETAHERNLCQYETYFTELHPHESNGEEIGHINF